MLKTLRHYLEEEKLDAFLVLTKINRQYLSGFTGSTGVLAVTKTGDILFVDDRYILRAKKETRLPVRNINKLNLYLASA